MTNKKRTAHKGDGPALKLSLTYGDCTVNVDLEDGDRVMVFRSIKKPPEEAGRYCVLTQTGDIETYDYTVDGGWNTFWDTGAEDIYREHAMTAEQIGIIAWAPTVPGCPGYEEAEI